MVGVLQGVSLQQSAVGEGPVAHVALEGALGTVRAHVHVERALLREALAAHGALEGPHARVHHHVFEEVVTQREGAPADGALMRFLTCGVVRGQKVRLKGQRSGWALTKMLRSDQIPKKNVFNSDASEKVNVNVCQPIITWHQNVWWLLIGFQIMKAGTKDSGKM